MRRHWYDFFRPRKHKYVCDLNIVGPHWSNPYPFARADIEALLTMIESRLSNAVFYTSFDNIYFRRSVNYVRNRMLVILKNLFETGETCIQIDKLDDPLVVKSPYTVETGDCMQDTLQPYLRLLDVVMNATLNLTENYGALGILSPANSSLSDGYIDEGTRKELLEEYNRVHGVTLGKWNLLVTKQDVKFQPIELPIEALSLSERRRDALSSILQFLNIPKELHSAFENSKYSNRSEAERDCYNNCISRWAMFFCDILERLYEKHNKPDSMPKTIDVWFEFENVSALSEMKATDFDTAKRQYEFWKAIAVDSDPETAQMAKTRIKELLNTL